MALLTALAAAEAAAEADNQETRFARKVFRVSLATVDRLLKRLRPGLTVHGFRSTFSDWAAETTSFPSEVRELALAHAVGSKVEAAYRRGDLFAKRRALAEAWASYCDGAGAGKVVALRAGG